MTDIRQATFSLPAATLTRTVTGRLDRTTLVFRCSQGFLHDVYVALNAYTPETAVILRFDRQAPYPEEWEASTDETALFAPVPASLLDSLLTHRLFRFRFTPYRDAPETATFRIPQLGTVGTTMYKACGIKPAERTDSLERAVAAIRLRVSSAERFAADTGFFHLRPLIQEVRDRRGRQIRDYTVGADISIPAEGRSFSVRADSIWLEPGLSVVTILVNDVPADSVLHFEVYR